MNINQILHSGLIRILNSHWRVSALVRTLTNCLPETISTQFWFYYTTGRTLDLSNPKTLTEKINWLKLYNKNPAYKKYVDRELVRHYVAEKSPDCHLPIVLLKTKAITAEQWEKLPEQFVLKASHGAGMVKIVNEKSNTPLPKIQLLTENWLSTDYSKAYREWVYDDLDRYVIAEEFLSDSTGAIPNDFKFYCLNGKVAFVCVDIGRFSEHYRSVFDREFELLDVKHTYPKGPQMARPTGYEKARDIAERLSRELPFARIDLYLIEGRVIFGEMTLIPSAGRLKITPIEFDFEMGKKLDLPRRKT